MPRATATWCRVRRRVVPLPRRMGLGQRAVVLLLLTVVVIPPLAGFYSFFSGVPLHLFASSKEKEETEPSSASASQNIALVPGQPHTVAVSEEVSASLGIRKDDRVSIAVAQPPSKMRPLVLPGSTAIIPGRLARIKARFAPARVVEIAKVWDRDPKTGMTEYRELRPGDRVAKGDLLGVFYSVDVGNTKNDLLDALVQLELDQAILDRIEKNRYAVPEVTVPHPVAAGSEGSQCHHQGPVAAQDLGRPPGGDRRDPGRRQEDPCQQGRVAQDRGGPVGEPREAIHRRAGRSPQGTREHMGPSDLARAFGGVIIEQNVTLDEMVADNTINLFQIADVSRLLVTVHCQEDDLPILEDLHGTQRRWNVHTVGAPAAGLGGTIDEIGYLIDPNQHTAIIKGYVDNPGQRIRGTQFASAIVNIPPPKDVVEIPVDALVDDGKQSLVFVQPDPSRRQFTMRRVQVTHRFADTVFVRQTAIPEEERLTTTEAEEGLLPKEPLRPGERVLTAGSVELKRVVIDLDSRPKGNATDLLARTKGRPAPDLESPPKHKPKAGKG